MNLGEEVALSLSYFAYAVLIGKIFAQPIAAALAYLAMVTAGIYVLRRGLRRWRYYAIIALLGILVAAFVELLTTF